jgi:glutaredoxin-related protein
MSSNSNSHLVSQGDKMPRCKISNKLINIIKKKQLKKQFETLDSLTMPETNRKVHKIISVERLGGEPGDTKL